jgi:hypothetical protein
LNLGLIAVLAGAILCGLGGSLELLAPEKIDVAVELIGFGGMFGFIGVLLGGHLP